MWFKRKYQNRRLGRVQVLDVKLRSSQVLAARARMTAVALSVAFGTVFGLYLLWRTGDWALNHFVYENKSFAIQQIDVQTDGVISPDQLRRWSAVRPGANLLALDLARVKRDLELVPMVQAASVERILPNTLRIRVTERQPVAQINVPRPRDGSSLELVIFQVDADGYVMLPLDPRQRAVPLNQADDQLPVISGLNTSELQPGRKIESAQLHSALDLIAAFESSPMAGQVDLTRVDVSAPGVLTAMTSQGSEVVFGLENFDRQLLRWQKVHEECRRYNKTIATLDLAVVENTPLRMQDAGIVPPPPPKSAKSPRIRKKNV
jgi:cell division septal protein FtsQ